VHWATIAVLVHQGFQVEVAPLPCCGALTHHAGWLDAAQRQAIETLEAFEALAEPYEALLFNSAGCGAHVKQLAHLFDEAPHWRLRAEALSQKVFDIHEWLAKRSFLLNPGLVEGQLLKTGEPLVVTYQPACHLHHAQGVMQAPLQLLGQLADIKLVPLPDATQCCGSAGSYNLEQPALAHSILQAKLEAIKQTNARVVAVGNPGCYLQLRQGLQQTSWGKAVRVLHPMQLMVEALGLPMPSLQSVT
jgi:glycolate oxidase iron-sulfur subunit